MKERLDIIKEKYEFLNNELLKPEVYNNKIIRIISEDNITDQFKHLIADESREVLSN